jgi:transcriptional regulator with XRE-family HTH domain
MARAAGRQIEGARLNRKWSARHLATKADLDFGYLRRIEKGQSASPVVYARLAMLLSLDLNALLTGGRRTPSRRPSRG